MDDFNDGVPIGGWTGSSDMQVLSVTDLTKCIRSVLEAEDLFSDVWVRGEMSNLTKHSSGHLYFSLKDESALVRCAMWANNARAVRFDPSNGIGVIVKGRITVYEKQGQYQLVCTEIKLDGIGSLYAAYEQLKQRLQDEGLFDESRKKAIPRFPRNLAIITSLTAAALRDMVTIGRRRMPSVNMLIVPTLMQGTGSEASVVESIRLADSVPGIDVVIVGRGGGSVEDLWTFNSELVVRAIAACTVPTVSAIGHETDCTLSDFVADLRAPTPSSAMELILPDRTELAARVSGLADVSAAAVSAHIARKRASLEALSNHPSLRQPERLLLDRWQTLHLAEGRLQQVFVSIMQSCKTRLAELTGRLECLSPLGVLSRGYGLVRRSSDGSVVKSVSDILPSESTETLLSDGRLISDVREIREGWG